LGLKKASAFFNTLFFLRQLHALGLAIAAIAAFPRHLPFNAILAIIAGRLPGFGSFLLEVMSSSKDRRCRFITLTA
jgi:hypothetical protein